ncbi:unnamed protein product [Mytilus edulis]|uniref:Ankyrin repeat-containing protein n=1 Tax=Mytilus edulis TaxID=6550 RepID=A0A8S3SNW5_MYTED|nr:unnamed protein product [Mytilus edulis]
MRTVQNPRGYSYVFVNPYKILTEEIGNIKKKSDIAFLAIALLVIQDNNIDRQILSLDNQTTKELLIDMCYECGFKYVPSTTVILKALNHLVGTYVQETDVGFACIHDTLFQNFLFIVGSSIIHCLLKCGNCTFIANRLQLASIQQKHDELVIMVKQEQEDIYFQRLVLDIRKGYHSHVFTAEDLTCDQNDSTPLHIISENGYEDLVFKLFQLSKEQINLQDKNKRTPLFMASLGCHNKVIQTLLALDNSSLHVANNEDLTPFDIASINDDVSTLTILHRYGAKVNRKDEKINRTALQRACDNGSYNAVTFLLTKNANVKHKDTNGLKAIHIACSNGHLKIVELLLNHDKKLKSVKQKIFKEKNKNLEQQKCIEALKIQLKNQQIIESERDQFKQELENLRQQKEESASRINVQEYVNQIQELKDQVIEKDGTVKMVQDLYYLRSTEFTDEIQSLKNEKQALEKEKADLCSKVNFQADSISQLTFQLQDLNHELHLVSRQNQQRPNNNNRHYNNRRGGRFR